MMCRECGQRPAMTPENTGGKGAWKVCFECLQALVAAWRAVPEGR